MSATGGIRGAGGPRPRRDRRNFPGSGWVPTSPPIGFPVYGLEASWPGARWLDLFGDEIGDPPRWMSLGHLSQDGQSLIIVTTYARLASGNPESFRIPTDAQAVQLGISPLEYVAADASLQLVNMTLPVPSLPRPPGFLRALVDHAEKAGREYAQWPVVRWRVDGMPVPARVWRFAGGWAAFTDVVKGMYLTAANAGPGRPEDLSIAVLHDGSAYHFDLDQPLRPGVLSASHAAGVGDLPLPQRQEWHADQLQLMR